MPYVWIDGERLYMDYITDSEIKLKEYQKKWQQNKRAGIENTPKKKKGKKKKTNKLEEKFICKCGGSYWLKTSKYNHEKSKRHQKYLDSIKYQNNLELELFID